MASKKFLELQEFSDEELKNEIKITDEHYQKLRFDHSIKGLENPLRLRIARRDLARLKTEARKRELATMAPEQLAKRSKIRARRRSKQ